MRRYAPSWVYGGAWSLAAVAGAVNAVAWLGVEHKGITHVTGALTEASTRVARLDLPAAGHSLAVIASFLVGALVSGVLIGDASLRLGRRYGIGLLVEGALLVAAYLARAHLDVAGADHLAAAACGLQNALATSFSGAVLRTTHMTGVVTDLGLMLGHALRGRPIDGWRLWLYLALLGGFAAGGVAGALASARLGPAALLPPAGVVLAGGVAHWLYRTRHGDPPPVDEPAAPGR